MTNVLVILCLFAIICLIVTTRRIDDTLSRMIDSMDVDIEVKMVPPMEDQPKKAEEAHADCYIGQSKAEDTGPGDSEM